MASETARKLTEREWRIVRAELRDRELSLQNQVRIFKGLRPATDAEERLEEIRAIRRKLFSEDLY